MKRPLPGTFIPCLRLTLLGLALAQPAPRAEEYWLQSRGLTPYELDLDLDNDGFTTRAEYYFGTDPFFDSSHPPSLLIGTATGLPVLTWTSVPGATYAITRSDSLDAPGWSPLGPTYSGNGGNFTLPLSGTATTQFFRVEALVPPDADGDGLSAIEEAMLGTNPGLADTDGDTLSDFREVRETFTNPLVANVAGGTISGTILTDPNGDGQTTDGLPVAGAEVYLDTNFNGQRDLDEPRFVTAANGQYAFTYLQPGAYSVRQILLPGQIQTLPSPGVSPVLDRLPDEVVNYTHAAGGNLPVPYGAVPDAAAVVPYVIFPPVAQPVDPAVVLKPIGRRAEVPALGLWSFNDHLTLPQGASVLLRFDELLIDGPGADLVLYKLTQGDGEEAQLEIGFTTNDLQVVTTIGDAGFAGTAERPVDFSDYSITTPIRYIRLTSLNNVGTFFGFEFVGAEAMHFAPPTADARLVSIRGTETVSGMDFARQFRDAPPGLLLRVSGAAEPKAGDTVTLRVQASDDVGLVSRSLTSNGATVALDADGLASLALNSAGVVTLRAVATDSSGQTTVRESVLYVNNADGSSPFDPNLLGALDGSDLYAMRFVTPAAGAILTNNTPVIASLVGATPANWSLEYAPIGLIDPNNLTAVDPDWISLGTGSGFLHNQVAGTLPMDSLPNGVYFLRLSATPNGGGATAVLGQALAKGLAPQDIEPRVTLTSPQANSNAGLGVALVGSITSSRPVVEWFAEYAPADQVDTANLGSTTPDWKRFAEGVGTVTNDTIAFFDASLVPDGDYVLRIVAWNDLRLGWAEPLALQVVTGGFKPGRLRREFVDLSLPLGDMPLVLRRVYDSQDADRDQGLGFGWSFSFLNPGLNETIPRTGAGLFGVTPFREGARVYIDNPEGRRLGFTFHAMPGATSLFGMVYRATFVPDPGVYETLETPEGGDPFLTIDAQGNTFIYLLGLAWNPDVYILTTPDGVRYTYHEDSGFQEARDASGNTLTATADGLRHSNGPSVEFIRDPQGRITRVNAPDGAQIDYAYDPAGDLRSVTDDSGRQTQFTYDTDPAHYLEEVIDPYGRVGTSYEYDANGRLLAIVDEDGGRREQTWNNGAFTGTFTDRNTNTTVVVYDARGNIVSEQNPLGQTTTLAYEDPANPDRHTAITNARGNTSRWTYDDKGNTTEMRPPVSNNELFSATYSVAGDVLTQQFPDGQTASYAYDEQRRMTRRTVPGEPATDYTYSPEGFLVEESVTEANATTPSQVTTREYDAQGRLVRSSDLKGYVVDSLFSASGDLLSLTAPGAGTSSFTYDASGFPATETDADGNSITLARQANGNLLITDRLGRQTQHHSGADGRLESITLPDGSILAANHDPERNPVGFTDASGNVSRWEYDALNRPVRHIDAAGAITTLGYDAAGNLVEVVNRNGKRRTFAYDANDRVTHERWHDAGGAVVREMVFTWYQGSLLSVQDGAASWDMLGNTDRPSTVRISYPGQTARTLSYGWANNGSADSSSGCCGSSVTPANAGPAPTVITLTGGLDFFRVEATYLGAVLQRLQWSTPDDFFGHDLHFRRGVDGRLQEIQRIWSSAVRSKTLFTWDALGRLIGQSHLDVAGLALHTDSAATLTRDAESRITGITRAGNTTTYGYDLLDQLLSADHSNQPDESYSYNAMGVRTQSHLQAGPAVIDAGNRLRSLGNLSYTYDAEGNVVERTDATSGTVSRYTYDHRNQLVQATVHPDGLAPASTTVEFAYDYLGRRISRSLNGAKTWTVYDREMPFAEFLDGSNTVSATFLYAPDRLDEFHGVWRAGVGARLLLTDSIGTVQGATAPDGTLAWWTGFDAFGNLRGATPANGEPLRFAGRFFDEALGLYDVRARFYDPQAGRFLQEDPAGFRGGDANLYRYARNNPLTHRDPSGRVAAIEYLEMVHETAKPEVFCKFGTCVARIWTGLVKSVATLRGSTPPNGNCGMELLELPSPPPTTFPALFHAGGMKVISKIPGLKTLKKTYDAAKECRALQKAMPGN